MGDVVPLITKEDEILEKICDYIKSHKSDLGGIVIGVITTEGVVEYMDITDHPMTASWIVRQVGRCIEEGVE